MDMTKRINCLSDSEALRACGYISNWLWSNQKAFEGLSERTTAEIKDDTIFIELLNEIAMEIGYDINTLSTVDNKTRSDIARKFLHVLFETNPNKVEESLDCPTFKAEPISTMLLFAGIVLFLSTEIEYLDEIDKDGRRRRKIKVLKKAITNSAIIDFLNMIFKN